MLANTFTFDSFFLVWQRHPRYLELPTPMGQEAKAQLLEAYGKMLAARRSSQPR